ncbi:MAG: hypothetical protein ACI9R3_003722 [Verrucomicrobiales bacterium]|jgi:hypothetical protein
MRKIWLNIFIASFLAAILIDGLPQAGQFHRKLKELIDPILDATGLWQESWRLFAPEVDKENVRLSAEILYEDGSISQWTSPDWTKMSAWEKFIRFRELEFYDSIRLDVNRGAWRSFADFLARTHSIGDSEETKRVEPLTDEDIHGNLIDLISGAKPGRTSANERTYFNAVGLAYADVGIAHAMYLRALEAGMGQDLKIQKEMIFEHAHLRDWVRM